MPKYHSSLNTPSLLQGATQALNETLQSTLMYSASAEFANRSTEKTTLLHKGLSRSIDFALGDFAKPFHDEFLIKVEAQYPGQTHAKRVKEHEKNHDYIIFDKKTGYPAFCIPIKNPQFSIAKNLNNYQSTLLGESIKLLTMGPDCHVIQAIFFPKTDIVFSKKGAIVQNKPLKKDLADAYRLPVSEHWEIFSPKAKEHLHFSCSHYNLTLPDPKNHTKMTYLEKLMTSQTTIEVDSSFFETTIPLMLRALSQKSSTLFRDIKDTHPGLII